MCCSGSIGVPGVGRDRRRQRRRQRAGLLDHGAPVGETGVLVPVGIVDQWIPLRRAPGLSRWLAGEHPVGFCDGGIDCGDRGGEVRVGLDDAERRVGIRLVLVSAIIFANVAPLPFLPDALSSSLSPCPPRPRRLASPAGRQRPVGFGVGDAAAGAQHGMRPGELMGRGADVHVGVVEHEVVEVDQLAVEPQAGVASVKWVRATKPARIGLLASRSSRRARESSAAASGPASFAHGSGSGNWVLGCKALITLRGIGQTEASTGWLPS